MQLLNRQPKWRWYHGAIFYMIVQGALVGGGWLAKKLVASRRSSNGEEATKTGSGSNDDFYNNLRQPRFAPPDWAFGPVWLLNNVLAIWGGLRVLNLRRGRRGRAEFLGLQAVSWAMYASFNALFFGLGSLINGALVTIADLALTMASLWVALFRLRDREAALSLSTLLPWLLVASATSSLLALWNRDHFYRTGPFVEPNLAWVKQREDKQTPTES